MKKLARGAISNTVRTLLAKEPYTTAELTDHVSKAVGAYSQRRMSTALAALLKKGQVTRLAKKRNNQSLYKLNTRASKPTRATKRKPGRKTRTGRTGARRILAAKRRVKNGHEVMTPIREFDAICAEITTTACRLQMLQNRREYLLTQIEG